MFSPSVFSPAGVSPSVFSPETFSGAQTRSLVAFASTPGPGDESITASTFNNTGEFYVRVSSRNGAASASPFTVSVSRNDEPSCAGVTEVPGTPTASAAGLKTLVLFDSSRMPATTAGNSAADVATLRSTLASFAGRGDVKAAIVDLAGNTRIQTLNDQATAHKGCPYAKNLVASAIKDIVNAYRATNSTLQYVVLVGPDGAIPFFRYPDEGLLGPESDYVPPVASDSSSEASLRLNNVLGQDEYGSSQTLALGSSTLPLPDLSVGRLVETAQEATGLLQAYNALPDGGVGSPGATVATPTKALVTGYDFLEDAANSITADLQAGIGTGSPVDTLISPNNISPQDPRSWTASQLRTQLLGSRHDLMFLGGHFSANSALAADFATSVLSTELATAAADFTNAIVFSIGCHSGYNIDDTDAIAGVTAPLDWAQAFSRKKATLIAGTGYQYGDTDFLEYSERIYAGFARQLRYGTGSVSVGQALTKAKQQYLKDTPDIRGLHRKSLLQSALFGLPMLSVNMPGIRLTAPSDGSTVTPVGFATNPGQTLGLTSADVNVNDTLAPTQVTLTDPTRTNPTVATYFRGPDGVVTNPAEPALPLANKNVSVAGQVLRGVGFRGGAYADQTLLPLTGAATTELRGVHTPFTSPVFYPMRLATVNYLDALSGGSTRLMVTPVQHRSLPNSTQSTARVYSNVNVRLFYSAWRGGAAKSAPPSLSGVSGVVDGPDIVFRANAIGDPAAGIQQVWVTYTGDASRWDSLDLRQCVVTLTQVALPTGCGTQDSTQWVGRRALAAAGANLRYVVQAVNGVGLVSLDDNLGAYYGVSGGASAVAAPTALQLVNPPRSGPFGTSITVSAVLTSNGAPVSGKTVTFGVGSSGTPAITNSSGHATATLSLNAVPGPTTVRASFDGEPGVYLSSGATSALSIGKSTTALAIGPTTPPNAVGPLGVRATLTDTRLGPLGSRAVYLVIRDPSNIVTKVVAAQTDYLGRASVSPLLLAPGDYTITAQFLGTVPTVGTLSDPTYLPSTASTTSTVKPPTVTIGGVSAGRKYVIGSTPVPTCSADDNLSGLAVPCTITVAGGNANGVGTYIATATATDVAGNTTTTRVTYKTVYGWGGFEQPINDPARQVGQQVSVFQAGSTVPTKFTLTRSNGMSIQPLSAPIWLTPARGGQTTLAIGESLYSLPDGSGTTFVQAGSGWRYNWKTAKTQSGYFWRIGVQLDDGETYTVDVALR